MNRYKKYICILLVLILTTFPCYSFTNIKSVKSLHLKESTFPLFKHSDILSQPWDNIIKAMSFEQVNGAAIQYTRLYDNSGKETLPLTPGSIFAVKDGYCLLQQNLYFKTTNNGKTTRALFRDAKVIRPNGKLVKTLDYQIDHTSFTSEMFPVYIYNHEDKYGFYNHKGDLIVNPIYDEFSFRFGEGLIGVKLKDKWGFVNREGELIIPLLYDEVAPFYNGIAVVKKDDKAGLINKKNEIIMPFNYYDIDRPMNETAPQSLYVYTKEFKTLDATPLTYYKKGIIDEEGNIIVEAKHEYIYLGEKAYSIIDNKKMSYLRYDNSIKIPAKHNRIYETNYPNRFIVYNEKQGHALIDEKNNILIPFVLEGPYNRQHIYSVGNIFITSQYGINKFSMYDKDGAFTREYNYTFGRSYNENTFIIKFDLKSGLMNTNGELIIEPVYDSLEPINENLIAVKSGDSYGIINNKGDIVVPLEYDSIKTCCNILNEPKSVILFKGNKSYIINELN